MGNGDFYRAGIKRYLAANPSATVREVMEEFNLSSPSHAHRYVKEIKGMSGGPVRVQLKKALERIKHLESCNERIAQAQHEATWAMAMEAAATMCRKYADESHTHGYVDASSHHAALKQGGLECATSVSAIPCPPLQTTNEKTE